MSRRMQSVGIKKTYIFVVALLDKGGVRHRVVTREIEVCVDSNLYRGDCGCPPLRFRPRIWLFQSDRQ
jgi:hypothetical protein